MFYDENIDICALTKKVPELIGAWASPIIFEVFVLVAVCWNAIDRPRSVETNLTRSLHRDGLTFFVSLTVFRTFNVVMFSVARPTLLYVGCFFVWSMNTLVLNRSLLNIQKAAVSMRGTVVGHTKGASSAASLSYYTVSGASGGGADSSVVLPRKKRSKRDVTAAGSPYQLEAAELCAGDSFLWVEDEDEDTGRQRRSVDVLSSKEGPGLVSVKRLRSVLFRAASGSSRPASEVGIVEIEMEETATAGSPTSELSSYGKPLVGEPR